MVTQRTLTSVFVLAALASCKPELEGRPSLVQSERMLAIQSQPAEAKPGSQVRYESLYVGPGGVLDGEVLDWALCNQRKGLAENGAIAHQCLFLEAPALDFLGTGSGAEATVAREACATFGPAPATPKPGEPNLRPVDPDTTGGYYQPVRVLAWGDEQLYAAGVTRLACGLAGATQAQTADFNRRFRANENPQLDSVGLRREDGLELALPDAGDEFALSVEREEKVVLNASWPECPREPICGDGICGSGEPECPEDCSAAAARGCSGAETYVWFDPQRRALIDRRESLRISWFATAGRFDHERTGLGELAPDLLSSENGWTAPEESRDVLLWVVIRDDRGGVGWRSYRIRVE